MRDAFFEYDAKLREIDFPPSVTEAVNSLLDADRIVIADLDAVQEASSLGEVNELITRVTEDVNQSQAPATTRVVDGLIASR